MISRRSVRAETVLSFERAVNFFGQKLARVFDEMRSDVAGDRDGRQGVHFDIAGDRYAPRTERLA